MQTAVAVVVSVDNISSGIIIGCSAIVTKGCWLWPDSFITSNVLYHLHIIVVCIAAFHGLDAAVKLGIVLVNEIEGILSAQEGCRTWYCFAAGSKARTVFACSPFVPVVDVDKVWIYAECFVPTVLEIYSIAFRVIDCFTQPWYVCGIG